MKKLLLLVLCFGCSDAAKELDLCEAKLEFSEAVKEQWRGHALDYSVMLDEAVSTATTCIAVKKQWQQAARDWQQAAVACDKASKK